MAKTPASILFDSAGTELGGTANPLRVDPKGNNGGSGVISALGEFVEVDTYGTAMASVQISGVWVGTLDGEISIDGVTWFPTTGFPIGGAGVVSSTSQNGNFRTNTHGLKKFRLRASAWVSGSAEIHINSTVRIGQIPIDGNGNIGVRVVSAAPPAGVDTVVISADNPLTVGSHDTDWVIPNGEVFRLQQLTAGNEDPTKGASVEIIYYDGAVEHLIHREYYNGASHTTVFPELDEARDGTALMGDGATKFIRVRRNKFFGADIAIDAVVYGYGQ